MRHSLCLLALLPLLAGLAAPRAFAADPAALRANPVFAQRLSDAAPQPSGDALFDRYAAEVWERNAPAAYLGTGLETAACLPDELLAQWEAEFGADPRYWQLRYFCARGLQAAAAPEESLVAALFKPEGSAPAAPPPAAYAGPDPLGLLEAGLTRGAYDCATLKELFYARLGAALVPKPGQVAAQTVLAPGAAEQLLPLAQRMVREFPGEADSWSALALAQFELGQDAAGVASLATGNAAPSNRYVMFFPRSLAVEAAIAGQAVGSKYVCGMIFLSLLDYSDHDSVWKKHRERLCSAAVASMDLRDWQVYQEWGLRQAQRKGGWVYGAPMQLVQAGSLVRELLVEHPELLTAEQRDRLWVYDHRRLNAFKRAFQAVSRERPDIEAVMFSNMFGSIIKPDGMLSARDQLGLLLLAAVAPGQFAAEWLGQDMGWGVYPAFFDDYAYEQGAVRDELIAAAQAVARWDWTLLDERQTAGELERQQRYAALADQLANKELTMAEAQQQMQALDSAGQ